MFYLVVLVCVFGMILIMWWWCCLKLCLGKMIGVLVLSVKFFFVEDQFCVFDLVRAVKFFGVFDIRERLDKVSFRVFFFFFIVLHRVKDRQQPRCFWFEVYDGVCV